MLDTLETIATDALNIWIIAMIPVMILMSTWMIVVTIGDILRDFARGGARPVRYRTRNPRGTK